MFELGTIDHWFKPSRGIQPLLYHGGMGVLKAIGHAHVINMIHTHQPKRMLEFGHGASTALFDLFENDIEMWGIDEYSGQGTAFGDPAAYTAFRQKHSKSKFIVGLLGAASTELPENYFDLVCSISVIEHIPLDQLPILMKEISRILRPGGIIINSYDLCYQQDTKPFFDAHLSAGLEWLKPVFDQNLNWDGKTVAFEDPRVVMDYYAAYIPEDQRTWPGNFATCLSAARKPR